MIVPDEEECKLTNINFRRGSDPTGAFQPALRVTCISDDRYGSTMGVVGISLAARWSTGENIGSTWDFCLTNVGIPNKL